MNYSIFAIKNKSAFQVDGLQSLKIAKENTNLRFTIFICLFCGIYTP